MRQLAISFAAPPGHRSTKYQRRDVTRGKLIYSVSVGARLDPPLLMALDEIGNRAALPSLPTPMAEGG